jgi:DnaJ domain
MTAKCWDVLGITPTSDLKVIKEARRGLVRTWHPDIVSRPEDQSRYTARCAEINAAYDTAVKYAGIRARLLAQAAAEKRRRPTHAHFLSASDGSVLSTLLVLLFTPISRI